jgi:hypothetical protein
VESSDSQPIMHGTSLTGLGPSTLVMVVVVVPVTVVTAPLSARDRLVAVKFIRLKDTCASRFVVR